MGILPVPGGTDGVGEGQCQSPDVRGMAAGALTLVTLSPLQLAILSRGDGSAGPTHPRLCQTPGFGSREFVGPWGAQQMKALEGAGRRHFQPQLGVSDAALGGPVWAFYYERKLLSFINISLL